MCDSQERREPCRPRGWGLQGGIWVPLSARGWRWAPSATTGSQQGAVQDQRVFCGVWGAAGQIHSVFGDSFHQLKGETSTNAVSSSVLPIP